METKASPVHGGISILHTVQDGKHHYEVENVLRYNKISGRAFARKGDKLLMINGVDMQNLTPEEFAELMTKGSPKLTIHQPSIDPPEEKCQEPGGIHPFKKEETILRFSLEMSQEDDLEADGEEDLEEDRDEDLEADGEGSDECGPDELKDLLLITMTNTSVTVVRGRGCDNEKPCHDYQEVVIMAETSKVTVESRRICNFLKVKVQENIIIQSIIHQTYLSYLDRRRLAMLKRKKQEARITIYYYKGDCVDGEYKGSPVLLNFTDTDNFLKCTRKGDNVTLSVGSCDKSQLKHILMGDQNTWPFVFYMKAEISDNRHFESAFCDGWFIHTEPGSGVRMDKRTESQPEQQFVFLILKK